MRGNLEINILAQNLKSALADGGSGDSNWMARLRQFLNNEPSNGTVFMIISVTI